MGAQAGVGWGRRMEERGGQEWGKRTVQGERRKLDFFDVEVNNGTKKGWESPA